MRIMMKTPAHAEKKGCFGALILSKVVKIVLSLPKAAGRLVTNLGL
jgi:hypothetical protein